MKKTKETKETNSKTKKTNSETTIYGKIGGIPVKACFNGAGLVISAEGYGDKTSQDGQGAPVLITNQVHGKGLEVVIWSDINEEDPTHFVKLDGAKESKRK